MAFNKQNESSVNQLDEAIISYSTQEKNSEAYNKLDVIDQSQESFFESVSLNKSSLNAQQESSPTSLIIEERSKKKRNKKKNQSDQTGESNSSSREGNKFRENGIIQSDMDEIDDLLEQRMNIFELHTPTGATKRTSVQYDDEDETKNTVKKYFHNKFMLDYKFRFKNKHTTFQ